jgi:hypothetical protein
MDKTIDMAREAGFADEKGTIHAAYQLKAFEALVRADERNRTWTQEDWTEYECSIAAAEREACAKVAEWEPCMTNTPQRIAAAIRARGQA